MPVTPITRASPIVFPSRRDPVLVSWLNAQPGGTLEAHPHYRNLSKTMCRRAELDYNYVPDAGVTLYGPAEATAARIAVRAAEFFEYQGFTVAGLKSLGSGFACLPLSLFGIGQRWTEPGRLLDHPDDRLGADPANPHFGYSPVCAAAIAETAADTALIAAAIVAEFASRGLRLPDLLISDLEYQHVQYYGVTRHNWAVAVDQPYAPYVGLGAPVYGIGTWDGWLAALLALDAGDAKRTQPIYEDFSGGAWTPRSFNDWWLGIGEPAYAALSDISLPGNDAIRPHVQALQYLNWEYRWRKGIFEPVAAAFGNGLRGCNYGIASSLAGNPYQVYQRDAIHADYSSPNLYPSTSATYKAHAGNTTYETAVLSWRTRAERVGAGPQGILPWFAERDGFTGMGYVTDQADVTDLLCFAQASGADMMIPFRSKDLDPAGVQRRSVADDASLLHSLGECIAFSRRLRALPGG